MTKHECLKNDEARMTKIRDLRHLVIRHSCFFRHSYFDIRHSGAMVVLLALACVAVAAEPPEQPILRLEPDGPLTFVTSLAYSPDGRTLYEAGWDKIVRVWRQDVPAGQWRIARNLTYR